MYILPCLSLQDLSENIYFCMKILNRSRTFVKKASKFTCFVHPKPLKFNFRSFYQVLFHIFIYCRVFLFKTYQNIYTFAHILQIVPVHSQKSLKNHMFRAPQALKIQFLIVLLGFKLHLYILPCLSLQDLSEYIYFCTNFLNSSRTFVKKASKSHVSCTPKPFKFNFRTFQKV